MAVIDVGGREERAVAGSALAACPEFGTHNTRRNSVTSHSQVRRTQSLRVLCMIFRHDIMSQVDLLSYNPGTNPDTNLTQRPRVHMDPGYV